MKTQLLIGVLLLTFATPISWSQNALSLEECIDIAISRNHEIMASKLQTKEAEIDLRSQKRERLPSLQISANNSLNTSYDPKYDEVGNLEYAHANKYTNQGSIDFSLPLWVEATNPNLTRALKLNAEASKANLKHTEKQIKLTVTDKFYAVVIA